MLFTRPLISKFSSSCINPLVTVPRAQITIGITVTFMLHSFFNSLPRPRFLTFVSLSFDFTLWSGGTEKSIIRQVLFFFIDYYKIWSSGRDYLIRWYFKTPEEFVRLILQDRFRVGHIPFVHMVKLQFLAQFPVDLLAHPVVYYYHYD